MFLRVTVFIGTLFLWYPLLGAKTNRVQVYQKLTSYLSSGETFYRSDQLSPNYSQLGLKTHGVLKDLLPMQFHWRGSLLYSGEESREYLNVRELYLYEENLAQLGSVSVGRKLYEWSHSEKVWRRGLWEPRFIRDKARPEHQGLFGVFINKETSKSLVLNLFASPIFIPELDPSFEIRDGQFYSKNPWFRPPVKTMIFKDLNSDIHYDMDIPNVEEIIFQPSFVFGVSQMKKGVQWSVNYAYKPMNQLFYKAPFVLSENGSLANMDKGSPLAVSIQPRVVFHHLISIEMGLQPAYWGWHSVLSLTHEVPQIKDEPPETWVVQDTQEATMADLLFGYGSGWKAGGGFAYVGLSHLWGGDLPTDHELLANNTFKFGRRYQYQKAFTLGWKYSGLRVWKRNLRFGVQSYYDWGQRAGAVFADVEMNLASNLFVKMTADAIGLIDTKDPEVENGLFRDYRANDRLSLEVNYVF